MSELRSVLRGLESQVASTAQGRAEFSRIAATRKVRRNRAAHTVRFTGAAVAATAALGTGVWTLMGQFNHDPSPAIATPSPSALVGPTPTPSASPSPSPSPSGRDAVAGPCPSRATEMSLDEANTVAGEPLTGETWLPSAVAIDAPAAAAATGNWDDYAEWFEVGSRDGKKILAVYSFMAGVDLIEEAADGSLTWIANPFPADTAGPVAWTLDGVAEDAVHCYESLALPTAVPLVDGVTATLTNLASYTESSSRAEAERAVGTLGASTLYRIVGEPQTENPETHAELPPLTLVNYRIKTPFGGWILLSFDPLEGAAETLGVTARADWERIGVSALTDYLDSTCGDDLGFEALVPATSEADWTVTGTLNGRDLAIATKSNPYAAERYSEYAWVRGDPAFGALLDFDAYLASPGMVALRADEGGWWVRINGDVSPRQGC